MKYTVTITETKTYTIHVEASSAPEAENKAMDVWALAPDTDGFEQTEPTAEITTIAEIEN